jgi:peptidoglycan/LPS O-acetylase OafA/YrhL
LAGVDWTLRIEVLFYLTVFGFMMIKSKVHGQIHRKSPTKKITHVIFLASILIFSAIPIFPNYPGTSFTGYLSIFFPIFLYGSAAAFHEQEKISAMSLVIYGVTSIFLVLNGIEVYRPDLYWVGPFVTYGYLLFTVAYIWRNNFKANTYVAWIASLTYSIYLFHKWLIPYIETFVVFLMKKSPLSSAELNLFNTIPVVNLLSVLLFFIIINTYVMNVEIPIIRWSKKISGPR